MKRIRSTDGGTISINAKQPGRPLAFRRKRGASLVEMLIAILVLGVVLISMLGMFVISRTAVVSKEDETAAVLALRYLEELEEADFSNFTTGFLRTWTDQNYKTTASLIESESDEYRAKVKVVVSWQGAARGEREVERERVISANGFKNVGEVR